jgi:hypothetical protein
VKAPEGCGAVARAWYGDPKHLWSAHRGADVTSAVVRLLARGTPSGPASNHALGGDPLPGVRKVLLVEFFLETLALEAAPEAAAVHPGVACDRSGVCPIVGVRYSVPGANYDLCAAEFEKLPLVDRTLYVAIARPGAPPVPCTFAAHAEEAEVEAEAPSASKAAGEAGFVESEVGRLEALGARVAAQAAESEAAAEAQALADEALAAAAANADWVAEAEAFHAQAEAFALSAAAAAAAKASAELSAQQQARREARAAADAEAVARAVAAADAAVAQAAAQSWGSQPPTPDGSAHGSEGDGSSDWEHVEAGACPDEAEELALSAEMEDAASPGTGSSATFAAEAEPEDFSEAEPEDELAASLEGAALAGSQLQADSSTDDLTASDLSASVSLALATAASDEAFGVRLAQWRVAVGQVMELGFDDVSAILDALEQHCGTPAGFDAETMQQVVNDLLSNMHAV